MVEKRSRIFSFFLYSSLFHSWKKERRRKIKGENSLDIKKKKKLAKYEYSKRVYIYMHIYIRGYHIGQTCAIFISYNKI